ncbi:hypothetical protein GCM10008018_22960 [Paenibacillus marchantiophytorum]|uniref:ATPase n=1 Tax=Paenibacillus marchantiophytorum TaxID=1619310 RepID=A0ABQ1EL64_9BACL|nr:hypothetical protein [Paenibacillus marchantiophytorum]GFZ76876.1 hypothetical protein GCM10008018_22960 [Paenibacillus marchantiophytorum]
MDQWITFAQDRWYLIVAAIIVLFIVVGIVKTVVKWVVVLAIVGALVVYGASYKDKIKDIGASVVSQVGNEVTEKAVSTLTEEAKDAQFKANPDGSYLITTKSLKVEGKSGSDEVQVTFLGKTFKMNANAAINTFIEQAKKNAKP